MKEVKIFCVGGSENFAHSDLGRLVCHLVFTSGGKVSQTFDKRESNLILMHWKDAQEQGFEFGVRYIVFFSDHREKMNEEGELPYNVMAHHAPGAFGGVAEFMVGARGF